MHTIFYLIRHGDAYNPQRIVYGRAPVHLTTIGIAKIHRLALLLFNSGVKPAAIFSSPIERTKETAHIISQTFDDLSVTFDERLQETDTGKATGLSIDYIDSRGDIYTSPEFAGLAVERPQHIITRMMAAFTEIKSQYEGKTVFLVSHGDPLAFLYWRLLHSSEQRLPGIKQLEWEAFLQKATAWRIEINEENKIVSSDLVEAK